MKEILLDIRAKLENKVYVNEEHIRLSLVARIMSELGWNLWDPMEFFTEFVPVRTEDNKKVDIALFLRQIPAVFIEVKADGKMMTDLGATEIQLRDYNKNYSAPFAIITDGRHWRFYYALTAGEFSKKCFASFNLVTDDEDDIERYFVTFMKKSEIISHRAKSEAERYLHLNEKQRTMGDCLAEARRLALEPPYTRLPEVLLQLIQSKGFEATLDEVEDFIRNPTLKSPTKSVNPAKKIEPDTDLGTPNLPTRTSGEKRLNPENPESLYHTRILEGHFDGVSVRYWKDLIHAALKRGTERGFSIVELSRFGNLSQSTPQDKSFAPIAGTDLFLQGMDANQCWKKSFLLAKKLGVELSIHFSWSYNTGAIRPGEEAILEWGPGK
jgi:hypothetical protein